MSLDIERLTQEYIAVALLFMLDDISTDPRESAASAGQMADLASRIGPKGTLDADRRLNAVLNTQPRLASGLFAYDIPPLSELLARSDLLLH